MLYSALDVSLRSVTVCIIDDAAKVRLERWTSAELPDLIRCLQDFGQPIRQVGLEAVNLSHHIAAGLTEVGYQVARDLKAHTYVGRIPRAGRQTRASLRLPFSQALLHC